MTVDKEEWMRQLKVGDVVCDCRYRHVKITAIDEESGAVSMPVWLHRVLLWMPNFIFHRSCTVWNWVNEKLNRIEVYDKFLTTEDDFCCSAMSCCSPPNHDESIHEEAIEAAKKWNEEPDELDTTNNRC